MLPLKLGKYFTRNGYGDVNEMDWYDEIKVNDKLNNDNFMSKASEEIINKFKNEANIYKSSIEKIDQIINTIK